MIDHIDSQIIAALHEDGRMTAKALSVAVGLSQPSVAERIKRLLDIGAIKFTVDINPSVLGYPISAVVRISPLPGYLQMIEDLIINVPEITQCDKVTGQDAFICRVHLTSINELDRVLSKISKHATTNTSIIKSSPVSNRILKVARV